MSTSSTESKAQSMAESEATSTKGVAEEEGLAGGTFLDDWKESKMREQDIQELEDQGFIPSKAMASWAPAAGEKFPSPVELGTVVVFESYFRCGFNLPHSSFMQEILTFYGLQLFHLSPNSYTYLSVFVHLCEAWLGTAPSLSIFRHFHSLKKAPKSHSVAAVCFQIRSKYATKYIPVPVTSSWQSDWKKKWFYITSPDPISHPLTYQALLACPIPAWKSEPLLSRRNKELIDRIETLRTDGLTGWHVAANFNSRRTSPLKSRVHLAWDYAGVEDPTRDNRERTGEKNL